MWRREPLKDPGRSTTEWEKINEEIIVIMERDKAWVLTVYYVEKEEKKHAQIKIKGIIW